MSDSPTGQEGAATQTGSDDPTPNWTAMFGSQSCEACRRSLRYLGRPHCGQHDQPPLSIEVTMTEMIITVMAPGNHSVLRRRIPEFEFHRAIIWAQLVTNRNPELPITYPSWQTIGCTEACAGAFHTHDDGCEVPPIETRDGAMNTEAKRV